MLGKVKIGEQELEMLANGATPLYYTQIFVDDCLSKMTNGGTIDMWVKVGFVMLKQAEGTDMKKVNVGQFLKWLEQFEPLDLPNAVPDILDLWNKQSQETAKPKK